MNTSRRLTDFKISLLFSLFRAINFNGTFNYWMFLNFFPILLQQIYLIQYVCVTCEGVSLVPGHSGLHTQRG